MTPPLSTGDDAAPACLSSQPVSRERLKVWAHFTKQDENLAQCSNIMEHLQGIRNDIRPY